MTPAADLYLRLLQPLGQAGIPYHLHDIAAMHRISGHLIDRDALDAWLERLDLRAEWRRATEIA